MNLCDEIKEQLWDIAEFGAGEIPAHIKEHLAVCSDCAAELEEIKKIKAELSSLHEQAPAELLDNVMCEVKKEPRRTFSVNRIIKICAASAAAFLVCVFAIYNVMLSQQKSGDMMAPERENPVLDGSSNNNAAMDKSEAETPEGAPGVPADRFSELLEFDFSGCTYEGTFPDDVNILYFAEEDLSEKLGIILDDCFISEISDRALYIGKSDDRKITELDELCNVKYTRSTLGNTEYFAVIVVKE